MVEPLPRKEEYVFSSERDCWALFFEDLFAESLQEYSFLDIFRFFDGKLLRIYWSKKSQAKASQYGEEVLGSIEKAQQYTKRVEHAYHEAQQLEIPELITEHDFEEVIAVFKELLYTYFLFNPQFTHDFLESKNNHDLMMYLGEQKNRFREAINKIFFVKGSQYSQLETAVARALSLPSDITQSLSLGQIRALYSNQQSQKSHTQFFIHISSGEKKITFDRKVVKELKATFVSTDTLQGVTGQSVGIRGVYRGRVKKLVLDYKDFSGDLQRSGLFDGDFILVANHTTPELLPMMKRSLAVVTDVGGILSHAAITCRELKKPCIIGTKIATQVLKDGDIVEVDAEEGVVRVISR